MRRKTAYGRAYARVRVALLAEPIDEQLADWRAERPDQRGCICAGPDGEPDCPTHGSPVGGEQ